MEGLVSKLTCLLENSLVDKNPVWSANRDSFLTSSLLTASFSTFSSSNFSRAALFSKAKQNVASYSLTNLC